MVCISPCLALGWRMWLRSFRMTSVSVKVIVGSTSCKTFSSSTSISTGESSESSDVEKVIPASMVERTRLLLPSYPLSADGRYHLCSLYSSFLSPSCCPWNRRAENEIWKAWWEWECMLESEKRLTTPHFLVCESNGMYSVQHKYRDKWQQRSVSKQNWEEKETSLLRLVTVARIVVV